MLNNQPNVGDRVTFKPDGIRDELHGEIVRVWRDIHGTQCRVKADQGTYDDVYALNLKRED